MAVRTDLALEMHEKIGSTSGVHYEQRNEEGLSVHEIVIRTPEAAKRYQRPCGRYITVHVPNLSYLDESVGGLSDCLLRQMERFDFPRENIVVAGIGNRHITPDALGPAVADRIFATRHLNPNTLAMIGIQKVHTVSCILPGVIGQTGIETLESIQSVIATVKARGLIVVDAFAAAELSHLGNTVQFCDSGLSPGSGVGNNRKNISPETCGVPVLCIGIPTCVEAAAFCESVGEGSDEEKRAASMIVTPKEIDLLILHASMLLSGVINRFLQPELDPELLNGLV